MIALYILAYILIPVIFVGVVNRLVPKKNRITRRDLESDNGTMVFLWWIILFWPCVFTIWVLEVLMKNIFKLVIGKDKED